MEAAFQSDTGKIRSHNEDCGGVFQSDNRLLAIVADGMGGHLAGDIASRMAVSYMNEQWEQIDEDLDPAEAERWLSETIVGANSRLLAYADSNPECKGMGTTLVSAFCTEKNITIGHVGDSRIYLLNENGFSLLTEDHSLVNELVKKGQLTKKEAEHHPRKHVLLRALGTEESIEVDIRSLNWEENDCLLLCSDGLTNNVPDTDIEDTLRDNTSIETKAETLIQLANQAGGDDNITIALIRHSQSREIEGELT